MYDRKSYPFNQDQDDMLDYLKSKGKLFTYKICKNAWAKGERLDIRIGKSPAFSGNRRLFVRASKSFAKNILKP